MTQLIFGEAEHATKKRKTHLKTFLGKIDALAPWQRLEKKLGKHYTHRSTAVPLSTMLRVHCLQPFDTLSDPVTEDALYEIESMRRFTGLDDSGRILSETAIFNSRHFRESRRLSYAIFDTVNRHLGQCQSGAQGRPCCR